MYVVSARYQDKAGFPIQQHLEKRLEITHTCSYVSNGFKK